MQTTDFANLLAAALGNAVLVRKKTVDWDVLEKTLGHTVQFEIQENFISFKSWLEQEQTRGALSLGVSSADRLNQPSKQAPEGLPEPAFRAFDGTSNIYLTVRHADCRDAWQPILEIPRRTDLNVQDITAYLEKSRCIDLLKSAMLWQNHYNLHFYSKIETSQEKEFVGDWADFVPAIAYWDDFLRSVSHERVEEFVETFRACWLNSYIPGEETERWEKLYASREKDDPPTIRYRRAYKVIVRESLPETLILRIAELRAALKKAAMYARGHVSAQWGAYFEQGVALFDPSASHDSPFPAHVLLDLGSAPEAVAALTAAVHVAAAFGGMGTWNDIPNYEDADYQHVCHDLLEGVENVYLACAAQL